MRRRSDRSKTKTTPKEEDSPDKNTRKLHKHSKKRRKSSSSTDDGSNSPKKAVENIPHPVDVQVQDIELPQGDIPLPVVANNDENEKKSEDPQNEWKEDNAFWETDAPKPSQEPAIENSTTEKEENSLWKVQSANGAGAGGEIQKLKICRQRPTESPELGESSSLHKRLSRGPRDSRSTDDSTHEESEKDTKKSKHRTRTSSRSPLVSPTVVCDMSEDSPTKIKIINVGHLNSDKGGTLSKTAADENLVDGHKQINEIQEDSKMNDTLDIALPSDDPPSQKPTEKENQELVEKNIESVIPTPKNVTSNLDVKEPSKIDNELSESLTEEDKAKMSSKKLTSQSPSPKTDGDKASGSRSSSDGSDSSENSSKPRKVKKKRRRELQSTVQRKLSNSASPKNESSDSEDGDGKKMKTNGQDSTDIQDLKKDVADKENEANNSIPDKDSNLEESNKNEETCCPMPRKRRWGSSKANRPNKKPILNISTNSLKDLIPDAKPVPAEELQLSMEEEEGQLDDDDEEDEVVALVAKEEEKQLERERQKEERQKEREKELEDKRKRQERFEKNKPEHPPTSNKSEKGTALRKILLLTDDAKKLARSPSPPRHKTTNVLYITHLVRPFTVQQLRNLLLRTGTIAENGFWMDKIKSKCYVEYTTEDAAVETRHALHGVRWPTSNPKTLQVEFASHDDLVMAQALSEEPEVPRKSEPLNMVEGWVAEQARLKERSRRAVVREWDVGKPEHPDEIIEYDLKVKEKREREQERKSRKERSRRTTTPDTEPPARKSRRKEEDAPAKLLDDLFRKTKTSPCIYWLPLTQEQISVKEEIRRQHMAEHERRMAELKKAELARRDRERRNRK